MSRSQRVDVGGLSLHVEESGHGPAILFGHSVMGDSSIFAHQVAEFSRDHRVITVDMRGHGKSDPAPGAYTVRDLSKDYMRVLDVLGERQAVIVGHGLGGVAALHLGLTNPERVSALVLINTTADEEAHPARARAFGLAIKLAGPRPELLRLAARELFSHTCHVAHPDTVEQWVSAHADVDGGSVAAAIGAMVSRPSLDQRLERIEMRTLAIAGSEDTVTGKELTQRIVDRMPNARMKTIQRAGHLSPVEKPYELTDVMRQFIRELREGVRDDRTGRIIGRGGA
jgi:3-oxoadipate enol-lactonase